MNAPDQFFTALVCVACGIFGGIFYDFFYCIRCFFRATWVRIVTDFLFCLSFGGLYLFVSVLMELPGLRLYTLAACFAGLFLYYKSFHKIVAFFAEKVYNSLKRIQKGRIECRKTRKPRFPKRKYEKLQSAQR